MIRRQVGFRYFLIVLIFLFSTVILIACGSQDNNPTDESPYATEEVTVTLEVIDSPSAPSVVPSANTPQPEITNTDFASVLRNTPYQLNDKGEDIAVMQKMLLTLGFDPGEKDGVYGKQLQAAIRNFQLYVGIADDGIAGKQTVDALVERYNTAEIAYSSDKKLLAGCRIGIDPGHQRHDNDGTEPVKPGSDQLKKKVSSGTYGRYSGIYEYVINLQVGLKLKRQLEALGAEVVMSRQTHNVDISNAQRAVMMSEADVDCWLRIHANGSDDPNVDGMFILVADKGGLGTDSKSAYKDSDDLAYMLLQYTVQATGAKNLGVKPRTDQTGFGWSSVPVCNIEMGHMTNNREDYLLISEEYQNKIVDGLTQGFIQYFSEHKKS